MKKQGLINQIENNKSIEVDVKNKFIDFVEDIFKHSKPASKEHPRYFWFCGYSFANFGEGICIKTKDDLYKRCEVDFEKRLIISIEGEKINLKI